MITSMLKSCHVTRQDLSSFLPGGHPTFPMYSLEIVNFVDVEVPHLLYYNTTHPVVLSQLSQVPWRTIFESGIHLSINSTSTILALNQPCDMQRSLAYQQVDTNQPLTDRQGAEHHEYEQLPSEPTIRLLQLLDSSRGAVTCVLTTHGLNNWPSYRTLSYTRGPPDILSVLVEGAQVVDRGECPHVLGDRVPPPSLAAPARTSSLPRPACLGYCRGCSGC